MRQDKPLNIRDIADLAGVTASAVSLALRDSPQVSDALKDKVQQIVEKTGFTPRKYSKSKNRGGDSVGKVLLIKYSSEIEDSVNAELETAVITRLNHHNLVFGIHTASEVINSPELLEQYAGVIYYFDPPGLVIPQSKKCAQIFGFCPLVEGRVRVTANDEQIAAYAMDYLSSATVKNMVMMYRKDMIINNWHPRVEHFKHFADLREINYIDFPYGRDDSDFDDRVSRLIDDKDGDVGFFMFAGTCAFDFYMSLNRQGLWGQFCKDKIVCGDTTQFLKKFWPQKFLIGAPLKELATIAVDCLHERLSSRQSMPGITVMPETKIFSGASLIAKQDQEVSYIYGIQ